MRNVRVGRLRDDSGQGLVEYVLILALASLGIMLALTLLRDSIGNTFQAAGNRIDATGSVAGYGSATGGPAGVGTAGGDGDDGGDGGDGKGGHGRGNGQGNSGNGNGNGGPNGDNNGNDKGGGRGK